MGAFSWFEDRISWHPGDFWREIGLPGWGEDGHQGHPSLMVIRVIPAFFGEGRSIEQWTESVPAQGLEAKKRSGHCLGGSGGTVRGQEENLGIHFTRCLCSIEGPVLRYLDDFFFTLEIKLLFRNYSDKNHVK